MFIGTTKYTYPRPEHGPIIDDSSIIGPWPGGPLLRTLVGGNTTFTDGIRLVLATCNRRDSTFHVGKP